MLILAALFACALGAMSARAEPPGETQIVIARPEFDQDVRQVFFWQVGEAALARTQPTYGPARFVQTDVPFSRQGMIDALERGAPLQLAPLPTSRELERRLLTLRIPLEMGLLSYRVSLIRAGDQARFDAVRSVDDLRSLTAGAGVGWSIARVFDANALPVVTSGVYRQLFSMLVGGRFDYFSRGVNEIWPEYQTYSAEHPGLAVESRLLLHAALPVYFFVAPTRPELARRLEQGLEAMVADGSLRRMVVESFGEDMRRLNLKQRRVIELVNPVIPTTTPFHRSELWLDPTQ